MSIELIPWSLEWTNRSHSLTIGRLQLVLGNLPFEIGDPKNLFDRSFKVS